MGLVCFRSGNGFMMVRLLDKDHGGREERMFEHENVEDEERSNPLTHGLMLYGHTYLSRIHATVQCMTMCRGTVDGQKFAKGIHTQRQTIVPMQTPSPPHIQC